MNDVLKTTLVPLRPDEARSFAEVVAASRSNGVYEMIDQAKRSAEPGAGDPERFDIGATRKAFDAFAETTVARQPRGDTIVDETQIAGVPALRIRPAGSLNHGTLIYLHGSGASIGSVRGQKMPDDPDCGR